MAKKRKFSLAETAALWMAWDEVCPICEKPLADLSVVTVDHAIPEGVEQKPELLAKLKDRYGLAADWKVNDFENWVPTHPKCNQRKGKTLLRGTYAMSIFLERAKRLGEKARRKYIQFSKNKGFADSLARLEGHFEGGDTSIEKMNLLRQFVVKAENDAPLETKLLIDPTHWKITRVNRSGVADVTDGTVTGVTVLYGSELSKEDRWICEQCKGYGPYDFDGSRCLTCGHNPLEELAKKYPRAGKTEDQAEGLG